MKQSPASIYRCLLSVNTWIWAESKGGGQEKMSYYFGKTSNSAWVYLLYKRIDWEKTGMWMGCLLPHMILHSGLTAWVVPSLSEMKLY